MSPTDKGSTPESHEAPEPTGEPIPGEGAPVEPTSDTSDIPEAGSGTRPDDAGVDLTKHHAEPSYEGTPEAGTPPSAATTPGTSTPGTSTPDAPLPGSPTLGTPIGGDYPAPESFASANEPASSNKKVLAIIAGIVVVLLALAAVLWFVVLKDDNDSSPEAQIKQVTQEYLDAMNAGKPSEIIPLVCEKVAATAPTDLPDQGPQTPQAKIDSFEEINVDGDNATATFTISAIDDEEIPSEQIPMTYVNEDGWKLCP